MGCEEPLRQYALDSVFVALTCDFKVWPDPNHDMFSTQL